MDHKAALERIRQQGEADRLPHYEQSYANFSSLRLDITGHIRGLEDRDPRAATADQISENIDNLLTLMQIMTQEAEQHEDYKAFLEERNFFAIPSTKSEAGENSNVQ